MSMLALSKKTYKQPTIRTCLTDDEMEDESQTRFQFDTPKCVVHPVIERLMNHARLSPAPNKGHSALTGGKSEPPIQQVEKQKNEHEQNMKEMKWQWDTTLREQQEQLATAQEEIERTRVQQLAREREQ
ncbi:uncharacterized protein EDB93DRAFT_1338689 [Suillus bovinus]|uniref:uncharacterized protein n=1 Tax=Suillus bovinus TaxID=48563 RepID=UPI001B872AC2|nr:uncharacterized protein EDB93DRAFT_1338689 [Suillus bovinus]KAG2140899.1 hypothetical protein EDB93DRAFT_1338689 [Suillus bovinus]